MSEISERLISLVQKRHHTIDKLIGPARAAANQMKDAGMNSGADPLLSVLFEIDAVDG